MLDNLRGIVAQIPVRADLGAGQGRDPHCGPVSSFPRWCGSGSSSGPVLQRGRTANGSPHATRRLAKRALETGVMSEINERIGPIQNICDM